MRVADAVAQAPRPVGVELQHLAPADRAGDDERALGLLFAHFGERRDGGFGIGVQVARGLPRGHARFVRPLGLGVGQHVGARLDAEHRVAPPHLREFVPDLLVFERGGALRHHGVAAAGRGEPEVERGVGRLDEIVVRFVRLHRHELAQERVADLVGHGARAVDEDEQRASFLDAILDVGGDARREHVVPEVAEDDHVELAPFVAVDREGAALAVAELAPGAGGRQLVFEAFDFVRVHEVFLQVHRLVAAVEQVAQVAELPAREVVRQQHVGAVVGHRHVERPFVVFRKFFAFDRVEFERVVVNAFALGHVHEAEFLAPIVAVHGLFELVRGIHRLPVHEQAQVRGLAVRPERLDRSAHADFFPLEDGFRRARVRNRQIDRRA